MKEIPAVNRREFVQGTVSAGLLAAAPVAALAATAADNADKAVVLAQVPKMHAQNLKRLQDWIALPSIADERSTETCYSCHDDTQRDSHPVGILYDSARVAGSNLRRSSAPSQFGSTIAKDLLADGRIECVSCHLAHAEETAARYRLRIPETSTSPGYSGLCMSCHDMTGR